MIFNQYFACVEHTSRFVPVGISSDYGGRVLIASQLSSTRHTPNALNTGNDVSHQCHLLSIANTPPP